MSTDDPKPDLRYHQQRIEQERVLARRAPTSEARRCHAELMRLHELRRDGLPLPG
jgi:hypothetical protein